MSLSIEFPQLRHKMDNRIGVVLHFVGRDLTICLKRKKNSYTIRGELMLCSNIMHALWKRKHQSILKIPYKLKYVLWYEESPVVKKKCKKIQFTY